MSIRGNTSVMRQLLDMIDSMPDGDGDGGGIDKTIEADIIEGVYAKNTFVGSYRNNEVTKVAENIFRDSTQLTEIYLPNATSIDEYAFYNCTGLTTLDMSSVETVGQYAFYNSGATTMTFPSATSAGSYTFGSLTKTTNLILPKLTTIPQNMVRQSSGVVKVDLGACTSIANYAFYNATKLETLIIRTPSICSLAGTNALSGTKIAGNAGYIYVPRELINDYKSATNWSTYSARFRIIEDYLYITGD